MTNFEAIVKNNSNYVKEMLAGLATLDTLKRVTTGELKHDVCYEERDKREMDFLNAEYIAPVLDDIEKKYLSDVIRPFKNRVEFISKEKDSNDVYFILIELNNDRIYLPYFSKKSGMYKGMKADKPYTLKELGL